MKKNKIRSSGMKAVAVLLCAMFVVMPPAMAADTDTVNVSFTLHAPVSITVTPDTVYFGNLYVGGAEQGAPLDTFLNISNGASTAIRVNVSCNYGEFWNSTNNIDIGPAAGVDKVKFCLVNLYPPMLSVCFGEDATQEVVFEDSLAAGDCLDSTVFYIDPPTSVTVPLNIIYTETVEFKAIGL